MKTALKDINDKISDTEALVLSEQTQEVSNLVAGYDASPGKMKPLTEASCCDDQLTGECKDDNFVNLLSRGGLLKPSAVPSDLFQSHLLFWVAST